MLTEAVHSVWWEGLESPSGPTFFNLYLKINMSDMRLIPIHPVILYFIFPINSRSYFVSSLACDLHMTDYIITIFLGFFFFCEI